MVVEKPFIHLFRTPTGCYLYDVNKNAVLKLTEAVHKILFFEQKKSTEEAYEEADASTLKQVESMKEEGFLSSNKMKEIIHPLDGLLEYRLNYKLRRIILQVTQQCNLRCRYCVYTNSNELLQRKHSSKRMSLEMAQRGIDYLFEHSRESPSLNIGFYGGEPILEFDLIKRCIEYAKEKGKGKSLLYNISTNGTLIKNEILEYFIHNNVFMLISLDGPREVHDRNRRFASDGSGTFDTIMDNIEKIRQSYPEYYSRNVIFNAVLDPGNDYDCAGKFLTNCDILKESTIRTSLVDYKYSDEKPVITEDYKVQNDYERFKLFLSMLGKIEKGHVSVVSEGEHADLISRFGFFKPTRELPDTGHPSGPCIPGITRLFMNVEGYFYPCERVSEKSDAMKIGHIDTGIDVEKARRQMNIGRLTEDKCKNCWAIRHCTMCAAFADDIDRLSAEKKLSSCNEVKSNIENTLKNYVLMKELGYQTEGDLLKENWRLVK